MLDRAPKHRHDVKCDDCKSALGCLIVGDERDDATAIKRTIRPPKSRKYEGLPTFSEEDLEAIAEVKARADQGTGRNSNRRKSGNGQRRRKKRNGGKGDNGHKRPQNKGQSSPKGEGGEGGEGRRRRRRRRRRGGGNGGGGGGDAAAKPAAAPADGGAG